MRDIEQLAKRMREQALADMKTIVITKEVFPEELKAVYFHAGRWRSGARDKKAREAYEQFLKAEK